MAHEIAHFSCRCSPLPDQPPTHPSSCLEFFPASWFFFDFMFVVGYLFVFSLSYSSSQIIFQD